MNDPNQAVDGLVKGKEVFLSYASPDKEAAFRLCRLLEERGISCWIAPRDVPPGADYGEVIIRAIESTTTTMVMLSAHANASIHVKHEVERANSKRKRVIPIRLDDIPPSPSLEFHLATAHWVDAWRFPPDQVAAQLADVLRGEEPKDLYRREPTGLSEARTPATAGRARDAQRRRLTVLQCGCDLFDAPDLQALDPEEQSELLLEFQQLCRDLAVQFEGTVVKATDRGLLLCFGFPVAFEDAARRAVRAGLRLLDRMPDLNERLGRRHKGVHLSARIAVHSDRAVVTESSGSGETLSIVGPVLSVVDQIEHLAAPDTVAVSDDTYQQVKGFVECTALGSHKLKGAAAARPIYHVRRELPAASRVDVAGPAGLTPLIGRDREVALLQERWEHAVEGMGQVVLLAGEAGIGKSRLVHILKEHVAGAGAGNPGALTVEWPCTPLDEGNHFHAIASYERIIGLEPHDGPSQKLDKLAAHLEKLHLAGGENVALMASLLLIRLDDRYAPLSMSPLRHKEKTLDLQLDWLRAQAVQQPVLFVVEDLHWAGPITQEFLGMLVGQAQSARLLVLLTFRPEFEPPWKTRAHHTQVSLNRLTRRQTGELMVAKSGLSRIPQEVLDQIVDRTDGVPLFVEEFTAMVLETGSLRVANGEVELSDAFETHAIPATLQDLLTARLDRMGSNLDVVQLAAALGREFDYELLAAAASCSEEILRQELAKLVEAELLFQQGRPPSAHYQFKHALIRDAAYQGLLTKKRQQFHARIADVLERRFPEISTSQPQLLAHHFTEGNVIPKAVTFWERAGECAQQRGAAVEAVGHFTRGLELISAVPATPERSAQEIQMHISLGVALAAAKGFGVAELDATFARAHALSLQAGLTAQLFPALFGRLRYCINRGMHAYAQGLAEEMLQLAERESNVGFLVCAHCALGLPLLFQGKLDEALLHLQHVVTIEATAELRVAVHRYVLVDPWVTSHSYLSWVLWLQGFPERAAEHSRQALNMAERLGHPFSLGLALCDGCWLQRFGNNLVEIRAVAARALALGTEKGFVSLIAWARIVEAWTLTEPGQSEQALNAIRQGLEELRVQSALSDRNEMLPLLAEACARAGRPGEGLQATAEALEFADATGEAFFSAELHRLKGELLLQHDPTLVQDAEACFHQALEVARKQQARALELRAAMSLARLWDKQGKRPAARELVAKIYGTFTEGFHTHDLQTARAWLEQDSSVQEKR